MKYPWINEYLQSKRGVTKYLQAESMTEEAFEASIAERVGNLK